MQILLTNDDGIRAPGIQALHHAILGIVPGQPSSHGVLGGPQSRVLVIAPETVQSATSHGITYSEPLMVREMALRGFGDVATATGFAVDGRPADCVKLGVSALWPSRMGTPKPDVLISGMNAGANCGINVIYSGTVAAAIEGAFLGISSIAVSLRLGRGKVRFDLAAIRARHVLDRIFAAGGPKPYEVISINIPTTEDAMPKGTFAPNSNELAGVARVDPRAGDPMVMPPIRVCPMNVHGLIDRYERRTSPGGDEYYWPAGHGLDFHATEAGTDVDLLMDGYITVTPLTFDLTKHASVKGWREVLEEG